jgi:cysteine sulfinate desulfinase/cysteine desulfurase-like protein
MAEAAKLIFERSAERDRLSHLADTFWKQLKGACPDVKLNGPEDYLKKECLA